MNFLTYLQLLASLGSNFPAAYRLIKLLIQEISGGTQPAVVPTPLSAEEQAHAAHIKKLMTRHGSLAASPFNIQDLLRDFQYIQAHKAELLAAIQAIIALFNALRPTPTPTPTPTPEPTPTPITPPAAI